MKKITMLVAMLALMMFAAVPAFAQDVSISTEIEDVEIDSQDVFQGVEGVEDSIVQNSPASLSIGDEFSIEQTVSDVQDADITVTGDENEVELEQSFEQTGFSAEITTDSTQTVSQAAAAAAFFLF